MLTKVTVEDLKKDRTQSVDPPVVRIGAVYNEVAAASGRYNKDNPAPSYALKKAKSREPLSFRRPPLPRPQPTHLVHVNPKVNLKAIFEEDSQDLPAWANE